MRKIIITDVVALEGEFRVESRLWLDVPEKRLVGAQVSGLPEYGSSAPWGITDEEKAVFRKGLLTERSYHAVFPIGTVDAEIQADLQAQYDAQQATLTKTVENTPDMAGASWDGETWSAAGERLAARGLAQEAK